MDASKRKITIPRKSFAHYETISRLTIYLPTVAVLLGVIQFFSIGVTGLELGLFLGFAIATNLGIEIGFHRNISHKAFTAIPAIEFIFAVLGSMAAQGNLLYWVSNHRRHHQFSDTKHDPHSPHIRLINGEEENLKGWTGFWHAQWSNHFYDDVPNISYFSADIIKNSLFNWIDKRYFIWVATGLLLPGMLAYLHTPSLEFFLRGVLWGGLIRIFLVLQITRSVASFAHLFGSRPFKTDDKSVNNWWIGIISFGSGYQNNHHAFPRAAYIGMRWYEFDLAAYIIKIFAKLGLASNVYMPSDEQVDRKKH